MKDNLEFKAAQWRFYGRKVPIGEIGISGQIVSYGVAALHPLVAFTENESAPVAGNDNFHYANFHFLSVHISYQ